MYRAPTIVDTIIIQCAHETTWNKGYRERERERGGSCGNTPLSPSNQLPKKIAQTISQQSAGTFFRIGHGHTQQAPRVQGGAIAKVHHVIEGGLPYSIHWKGLNEGLEGDRAFRIPMENHPFYELCILFYMYIIYIYIYIYLYIIIYIYNDVYRAWSWKKRGPFSSNVRW